MTKEEQQKALFWAFQTLSNLALTMVGKDAKLYGSALTNIEVVLKAMEKVEAPKVEETK